MELLQLRYFMKVMEQRNFTRAASAAFTTQSNVSKQISQLEEELGVVLFRRLNVGVEPTEAGERLHAGLQTLLPQLAALVEEVRRVDASRHGVVRLGLCDSMDIEQIIPNFFSRVTETLPEIEVLMETQPIDILLEKLAVGGLDVVFAFSVYTIDLPGVKSMVLNRKNPLIYFSKKHRLYGKKKLAASDFSDETFVTFIHKKQWHDTFEVLPFTPRKIITANSLDAVFAYVQSGAGVAVLGQNQSHLGKEGIATLEIPTETLKVGSDALWLENTANAARRPFLRMLEGIAGEA